MADYVWALRPFDVPLASNSPDIKDDGYGLGQNRKDGSRLDYERRERSRCCVLFIFPVLDGRLVKQFLVCTRETWQEGRGGGLG